MAAEERIVLIIAHARAQADAVLDLARHPIGLGRAEARPPPRQPAAADRTGWSEEEAGATVVLR